MRILSVLAVLLTHLLSVLVVGQIQTGELPPSFFNAFEKSNSGSYTIQLSDPDVMPLITEDAITDQHKDIAWRFGTLIPVNFNINSSGEWFHDDNNGTSIWKFKISFQHSKSINLNFRDFKLSPNAKLFVYNENYTDILGAITAKNNKSDRNFSIRPIRGNSITLELVIPQNELELNKIEINEVVYGYRSIHDKIQKVFQSSGNCNININCKEGENWQDVKRAVAMVTSASNTRFCTATLINNVRQDTTPYILTAAHCVVRNNSIFIFGYESAACNPNTNGMLSNSISGSSRRAITVNFGSDFELRELSSSPPSSYNVYYAGWNNQNVASSKSVCIHHPVGDVKKIAIDNDVLTTSGYYSTGVTHWQVGNWEKGTTQSASSGSCLFDANQRIIGQLHGGDASCNNRLQDYFGKFSRSWDFSADTARQLKRWLDPDNTGALVLNGLDPNPSTFSQDLDLLDIDGIPDFECTQTVQATFRVKNLGNNVIDSFYVDYKLNGNPIQTILYSSSLNRQEIATITSPVLSPVNGSNVLTVSTRIAGLNDQNTSNNIDSVDFMINTGSTDQLYITLKTDNYGSETTWQLEDLSNGSLLYSSPSYPDISGGAVYNDSLCVYTGCFRFSIFDSQSDGFNDPSGNFGNGYMLITKNLTDTLFFENNFTTAISTDTFCVQFSTSLNEIAAKNRLISVYPNPINAGETLQINSQDKYILRLRNIQGQLIEGTSGNRLNTSNKLSQGIYLLEILELNTTQLLDIKKVLIR